MPQPRLIAVLTALMLLSSGKGVLAGYTYEQLVEVDRLVGAKDYAGLMAFVEANPQILIGNDPLANELRVFLFNTNSGNLTAFDSPFWKKGAGNTVKSFADLPSENDPSTSPKPY